MLNTWLRCFYAVITGMVNTMKVEVTIKLRFAGKGQILIEGKF